MPPPSRADLTPRRFSASRRFCATCSSSGAAVCGAGGVMAWERGAGKGREGAEGVDVDYAPRFSEGAAALHLMFSPVAYLTEAQAHDELHTVIDNIRTNCEFLRSLDRPVVVGIVF